MICCLWWLVLVWMACWVRSCVCPAVVSATSVGHTDGAVVGGRPIDVTIASTETDPGVTGVFDDCGMLLHGWLVS